MRLGPSFDALSKLRNDLCELDMRFGQVGGIADEMSADLEYRMFGDDEVAEAVARAPGGRARARGDEIRRLGLRAGSLENLRAGWDFLNDGGSGNSAELLEPADESPPKWYPPVLPPPDSSVPTAKEIKAGMRVILGRHAGTGQAQGWNAMMQRVVGEPARVSDMADLPSSMRVDNYGCRVVPVTVERNKEMQFWWRTQSMTPVSSAQAAEAAE
jgi:hypothetical protein